MRNIPGPEKLNTSQDLINVCGMLKAAQAAEYLEGMDPEHIKRLGIKQADLKAIKKNIAERKEAEDLADENLKRLRARLTEAEGQRESLKKELDQNKNAIYALKEAKNSIAGKEKEYTRLQESLTKARVAINNIRPINEVKNELDETERTADSEITEASQISAIKEQMRGLAGRLKQALRAEKRKGRRSEIKRLRAELIKAEKTEEKASEIPGLVIQLNMAQAELQRMNEILANEKEIIERGAELEKAIKALNIEIDTLHKGVK